MRKQLLILSLILLASLMAKSQISEEHDSIEPPTKILSLVPQYAIINGLRVDYDFQMSKNHWIQIAPTLYAGKRNMDINDFYSIKGFALQLYHRYHPGEGFDKVPVYLSVGPVYQYFQLRHEEYSGSITEMRNTTIHRVGADILIGIFNTTSNTFIFDLYTGLGLRHAFLSTDAENEHRFDETFIDYGYSGTIWLLGLRIGIPLN